MNILNLLKDSSIPYSLGGKNVGQGWIGVCCPYCGDSSFHGAFPVSGSPVYTCFKCGSHPFKEAIKQLLDKSWSEVYSILKEYDDGTISKFERKEAKAQSIEMIGDSLNDAAKKYLRKRGFEPEYLEIKYKLRSVGMVGEWKYRIIIPIFYSSVLVSYIGRDYTNRQELRYKNLSIEESVISPKKLLYNEQFVKGTVIGVCEGSFDAMRLGDGFVATLGTQVSEEQVRKIAMYEKAYIVFDPEEKAQKRALKLAERIGILGCKATVIDTELDHDPGDMTKEEVKELRKALDFY